MSVSLSVMFHMTLMRNDVTLHIQHNADASLKGVILKGLYLQNMAEMEYSINNSRRILYILYVYVINFII